MISRYSTMNSGICRISGRHPARGLALCSLYSFIISSLSFWRSPLCLACSFFSSGCNCCMARCDFTCLAVRGISTVRTVIVSMMMAKPYDGTIA